MLEAAQLTLLHERILGCLLVASFVRHVAYIVLFVHWNLPGKRPDVVLDGATLNLSLG